MPPSDLARIATASVEILPDTSAFGGHLKQGLEAGFGSTAIAVGNSIEDLGKKLFKRFTIPFGIAMGANIALFQSLNREINTVLTLLGTAPRLVERTFDDMASGVRDVAEEIGGLERDISGGLYQAISAGVPKGGVFEFLEVSQMAAMADRTADLTTAVDGISTAVNAFSAESLTAKEASDTLFAGVAVGKTTFGELGQTIGRSAGLAAQAGTEFAEFIAIISQMTKSGLQTSEAVSFLRAAITGMLRPSEDMNEIFEEIGFSSAEAAVPVIGLSGAFSTVVEAAGGSTSRLQELVGTSEGVSAILAVTGDNADAFAQTLNTVENAAGSTERAFGIMETGTGRSFGRMTESFDRLGNTMGSLGAEVVVPFVDVTANLVSGLARAFEPMIGIARGVGDAIAGVLSVFEVPVVQQFTQAILAVGVSLFGLLAVVGPILVPLGNLIVLIAKGRLFVVFAKALLVAKAAIYGYVEAVDLAALKQGRFGKLVVLALKPIQALRTALIGVVGAARATAVTLGIVGAAAAVIAGLTFAFFKLKAAAEEAARANDIFGEGVSLLLDNAGIVENAIPAALNAAGDAASTTSVANAVLIGQLNEILDRYGQIKARDFIVAIGASLVWKGATPEQAFIEMEALSESTGIQIPISLSDFTEELDSVEVSVASVQTQIESLSDWKFEPGSFLQGREDMERLAEQMAQIFTVALGTGETDLFEDLLRSAEDVIGVEGQFNNFLEKVAKGIEDVTDLDMDLSLQTDTRDVDALLAKLHEFFNLKADAEKEQFVPIEFPEQVSVTDHLGEQAAAAVDEVSPKIQRLVSETKQQGRALKGLMDSTGAVFREASEHIETAISGIRESFERQIPAVIQGYEKTKISLGGLREATQAWQEDIDLVVERADLINTVLTPEGKNLFDAQSVGVQAGLVTGHVDTVKSKLEEINTLAISTDILEDITIADDMERIIGDATTIINTGLSSLATEAGTHGAKVASQFLTNLESGAGSWVPTAEGYVSDLKATTDITIPGPTVNPPKILGSKTTYTVYVRGTTTGGTRGSLQRGGVQP